MCQWWKNEQNLSEFDKSLTVMARQLGFDHLQKCSSCAVLQWPLFMKSVPRKEQRRTSDSVMGGQGSVMHMRNEANQQMRY